MTEGRVSTLLRSRILWVWLAAYIPGILISEAFHVKPATSLYVLPLVAVLVLPALFSRRTFTLVLLVIVALALGFARNNTSQAAYNEGRRLVDFVGKEPVRLVLEVDRMPDRRPDYTVFYGTVKSIKTDGSWLAFNSPLRLAVAGAVPGVYRGDRIMALASLSLPSTFDNPGGFDYEAWLGRRGISVIGFVRSPRLLHKIWPAGRHPLGKVDVVRERYLEMLHAVEGKGGALLAALLAGDRRSLPASVESVFEDAGLSHLLAISGLHLGLLAVSFFFLFHRLLKKIPLLTRRVAVPKTAAFFTIPPVIAYALLTGMRVPTQRALVMVLVFLFAIATERQKDTWNALAAAALAILFIWPTAIYEVSFQLSFTCLAGILYAMPRLTAVYRGGKSREEETLLRLEREARGKSLFAKRAGSYFAGLFAVSAVALWGVFPLQVFFFHNANPLSPLYNLVAVPICGLVLLPFGLVSSLVAVAYPAGGEFLLQCLGWVGTWLIELLELISSAVSGNLVLPSLTWFGVVCWYLGGVVLLEGLVAYRSGFWSWRYFSAHKLRHERLGLWPAPVPNAHRFYVWTFLAVGVVLFSLTFTDLYRSGDPFSEHGAMVAAIEVGQGESLLVRTDAGRYLLVDGGGFYLSDWDVGKNVVAPCLLSLGLRRIDAVVLSHPHPDHGRGLAYILRHFRVGELWMGPACNDLSRGLVDIASSRGVKVRRLSESSSVFEFGSAEIKVLHPPLHASYSDDNLNNSSLVLRLKMERFTILLTGDIEQEAEKTLVDKYGPEGSVEAGTLGADVISVPHHGSKTSSTDAFLEAVSPGFALVSGAGPSRTSLPSLEVLEKYRKRGIRVLRTDVHGFSGVFQKEGSLEVID